MPDQPQDRLADLRARFNDDVLPTQELYEFAELLQARVEELERQVVDKRAVSNLGSTEPRPVDATCRSTGIIMNDRLDKWCTAHAMEPHIENANWCPVCELMSGVEELEREKAEIVERRYDEMNAVVELWKAKVENLQEGIRVQHDYALSQAMGLAENVYGDEVAALGTMEPVEVGQRIAAAIGALKPAQPELQSPKIEK